MRLLLLLAAVIGTAAGADQKAYKGMAPTHYKLAPSETLSDGSIITFYFYHNGTGKFPEMVDINFYDKPEVAKVEEEGNVIAQLEIVRNETFSISTGSQVNGKWRNKMQYEQYWNEMPGSNAWWRIDLIKHDKNKASVYIQGCYSGLRTFNSSLNNIKSIYLLSNAVNHTTVKVLIKKAKSDKYDPKMTLAKFDSIVNEPSVGWGKDKSLLSFAKFPVGKYIEMIVVMRALNHTEYTPSLIFKPKSGAADPFIKIYQLWDEWHRTHELHFESRQDERWPFQSPNGELQHLRIERYLPNEVRMTQLYYPGEEDDDELTARAVYIHEGNIMDAPFAIMSHHGALILYLESDI